VVVEDIPSFKYITNVLKETLRLYPPAANLTRIAPDNIILDGKFIAKDTPILSSIYSNQRDPRYWKDPEHFIPERFEETTDAEKHGAIYIPFSLGSRDCIGRNFFWIEAKILIAIILQKYTFRLSPGQNIIPTSKTGTMHPSPSVNIILSPRVN